MHLATTLLLVALLRSANAIRTWELPIEYAIDDNSFAPLGNIELSLQYDGNYTGRFVPDRSVQAAALYEKLLSKLSSYYRIRSGDVFSSNLACLMAKARLQHEFALALDSTRQKLISLTAYPHGIYDEGADEGCDAAALRAFKPIGVSGTVVVTNIGELPSPDVVSYLSKLEEEKRARQHGAAQDNRSFIAKYWMYIVPVVIIMMFSSMTQEQTQE